MPAVQTPPTANSDIDRTANGIATGNFLTGLNTLTGAAGQDFGGRGGYSVVPGTYALTFGNLTIDANGNYTYAYSNPGTFVPAGSVETFDVRATMSPSGFIIAMAEL